MKLSTRNRGMHGEEAAARFLKERGYTILTRNWSCKAGEIDLIARKTNALHFIEVKFRNTTVFGGALAAIDSRKQAKLRRLAEIYLASHEIAPPPQEICMSCIGILHENGKDHITWLPNAFGI